MKSLLNLRPCEFLWRGLLLFLFNAFLTGSAMAASVTAITPARNARQQPASAAIVVQFDTAIEPMTVTANSLTIWGELSGKHAGTFSFGAGNTEITFTPATPFASGETVYLNVSLQIHDSLGAAINPFASQFTVRSGAGAAEFARGVVVGNTGGNPLALVAFDLNGDGKLDLVVGNTAGGGVSVLMGNGNGTFASPVPYPTDADTATVAQAICVADVNGDGYGDILVANYAADGFLGVLLNNGTGQLGAPTTYAVTGLAPASIAAGDLDGDGYADVVLSHFPGAQVFFNDGTGHFPASAQISGHDRGEGVALGDLNGDGLLDILSGDDRGGYLSITLNLGSRTFTTPVMYPAGDGCRAAAAADLNGDGFLDVMTSSYQNDASFTTYVNMGNGTFTGRTDYRVNANPGPWDMCVADFNGDGRLDVATANINGGTIYPFRSVSLWMNSGGTSAAAAFNVRKVFDTTQSYPTGIAFGDFDGDGDLDLVTASYLGAICLLRNSAASISGLVYRDVNANCARNLPNDIGAGGHFIRVADSAGGVWFELSRTDGTFASVVPAGSYTVSLVHDADTSETCNGGLGVTYNVNVSGNTPATGLNFGLRRNCQASISCVSRIGWPCPPNPPVPCTHGTVSHLRTLCPCEPFQYAVTVCNSGTDPLQSGAVIRLQLPQEVMYCGFPPVISDHATWNIDGTVIGDGIPNPYAACNFDCEPNTAQRVQWTLHHILAPGECVTFFVNVQVANVPLGTIPCAIPSFRAFCTPGHVPLTVIGAPWCDKILCSFDPNDLSVSPAGCGPSGNVPVGTVFTYRLRFQNLGTAAARRVVVRNPLDPALDPETLEVLSTSHTVTDFRIWPGQEMVWTFDGIDLPPAASDELQSHGEILYRVRPKTSAGTGTAIRNVADIYFDLNAPVRTVATLNTISADPAPVAEFQVSPRPGSAGFTDDFTYTGGTAGATFLWDFGADATPSTSTQQNPAGVVFNHAGSHIVTLRTSLGDCQSEPAAHVVTVGRPLLVIASNGGPLLSWEGDGYRVQETDSLTRPIVWRAASATPVGVNGFYSLQLPEPTGPRFYRLEEIP